MLDLRWIRKYPQELKAAMKRRGADEPVDESSARDQSWRQKLATVERLKAERNEATEAIGRAKREGKDASEAIARMKDVAAQIRELDQEVAEMEARIKQLLLEIPNIPHETVPDGQSDEDNVE